MFWKLFSPDQWSAVGMVVSAFVAVLNLIVVIILLRYNRRTTSILQKQSLDAHAQTAVAVQTLVELTEEKKRQNGRELLRTTGRLLDLNDQMLGLEGATRSIKFEPSAWKLKPPDWHEVRSAVIEYWPEGTDRILVLERKLREIDLDLQLLSSPLSNEEFWAGREHLKQLLDGARPLLSEIAEEISGLGPSV